MIVNNTQTNYVKNKAINNLVKAGVEPTVFEVSSAIDDYFLNYKIGRPSYKPLQVEAHTVSDKAKWNKSVSELGTDIEIMMESVNALNDNVIAMEDTIDYKKTIVESKLKNLNLRVDSLKSSLSSDEVYLGRCFTFYNFYGTEFYGDKAINLPYTTSYIDLLYKRVTSPKTTLVDGKYDLSGAEVHLTSGKNADIYSVNGDLSNMVNDLMNASCMIEQCSAVNSSKSISVTVTLNGPITISTISLSVSTINKINADLILNTVESGNVRVYSETFTDTVEWNFEETEVLSFEIILTKDVADGYEDDLYMYYYIIKNISATLDTFEPTSTYVSNKIEYDEILDAVNISVDEMVMPDTNIQYFVGIDNGKDVIDWINVKNGVDTSLNVLNHDETILNNKISGYGTSMGNGCYKIGSVREHINRNSLKILSGYQQWNAEIFKKPNFDSNYKINLADYDKQYMVGNQNIDTESYKLTFKKEHLVVMQTTVFCNDDTIFEDNEIKCITENSKLQSLVFINNNLIPINSITGKYHLPFKKGRNKVIVLMYGTGANEISVVYKFDFKRISQNIGCGGKMKLVSLDALKYRVKENTNNYYSIDSSNNIIVKYNPSRQSSLIRSEYDSSDINFQDSMRYFLSYKYLPKSKYNKCLKNGVPNVTLRFMATLFSNKDTLSPQIKSYSVLAK